MKFCCFSNPLWPNHNSLICIQNIRQNAFKKCSYLYENIHENSNQGQKNHSHFKSNTFTFIFMCSLFKCIARGNTIHNNFICIFTRVGISLPFSLIAMNQ